MMTGDEARDLIDRILSTANQPQLNDLQAAILRQVWQGNTSQAIADQLGYKIDYINQVAAKLWQTLSTCLNERVSKKNVKAVLHHYLSANPLPRSAIANPVADWGESIDISQFYGRETELEILSQWIVGDRCRSIGIFGLGGIGKTAFSIKLAQTLQADFEVVLWRSLRQTPTLQSLLESILPVLKGGEIADLAEISIDNLVQQLRLRRCLMVLDNIESIMQSGDRSGTYLPGYENYGYALERLCDESHQSCLIVSGREKPGLFSPREGDILPVRSCQLQGLTLVAAQKILGNKGSHATHGQAQVLIDRLGGNPLALKIVASNIYNLFNNDITAFLAQGHTVFGSLWQLLDQQFQRLSPLQKHIMYWLAIVREGISPLELQTKLFPPVALSQVLEALTALRDRSAIETTEAGLTQQPVVMEYTIERFIASIVQESIAIDLALFTTHALFEAKAPDYVRQTQAQIILYPLGLKLLEHFGSIPNLVAHLQILLDSLRSPSTHHPPHVNPNESLNAPLNYAAGNLLNLLCHLKLDLQSWDFSTLSVRQAYLAEVLLRNTHFNNTRFTESVFAETFGAVTAIAYSPNGQRLVTGSTNGEVKIWDANTYQELLCCSKHKHWILGVCYSPDSNYIASASDDYTVKLWNANTGQCLQTYIGHEDSVNAVAFSPNGDIIASGAQDSTIRLWSTTSEFQIGILRGHQGRRVWAVVFLRDGKRLASCGEDRTIRLWDVQTGDCLAVWQAHSHWARSLVLSPDGQLLASSSFDRTIKIWDIKDIHQPQCLQTWSAHQNAVVAVAFSPDGFQLASASNDRTVKLWDVATGKCLKTFFGHTGKLWAVSFHPQKHLLASGAQDHTAKIWNLQTGACAKTLTGHSNEVLSVAVSPGSATTTQDPDRYLASSHQDRAIRIWHLPSGKITRTLQEHTDMVWSVAFSPNGEYLVSGSSDDTVKLWQWRTGKLLQTFRGHQSWVWIVAFCPDNLHFASGSYDQTVKIWNGTTGECRQTLLGHTSSISSLDFSPDGKFLASGSYDNTIRLWDLETGECVRLITDHENSVWSVKFSPNGKYFASGSFDCTIKLWDMATGACLRTYRGHPSFVKTLQFTPDGQKIVSGGFNGEIKVWDVESENCLATLEGYGTLIQLLDVAELHLTEGTKPKLLAFTGNYDETIKIWDLESYKHWDTWKPPRPYEGMSIQNVRGLNESQIATLLALGAVE
jgi:WD40 repeat protein